MAETTWDAELAAISTWAASYYPSKASSPPAAMTTLRTGRSTHHPGLDGGTKSHPSRTSNRPRLVEPLTTMTDSAAWFAPDNVASQRQSPAASSVADHNR